MLSVGVRYFNLVMCESKAVDVISETFILLMKVFMVPDQIGDHMDNPSVQNDRVCSRQGLQTRNFIIGNYFFKVHVSVDLFGQPSFSIQAKIHLLSITDLRKGPPNGRSIFCVFL